MRPMEFEPAISAGDWWQTYAWDRAATATVNKCTQVCEYIL